MSAQYYQRRSHLVLFTKLLSNRENISPLTLVIDSLEQTSKPLLRLINAKARVSNTHTIYVTFQARCKVKGAAVVEGSGKSIEELQRAIRTHILPKGRNLIIFESLNILAASHLSAIASFLSSFVAPNVNLVATYHADVNYPLAFTAASPYSHDAPEPLRLLRYMATTILTVHSFAHMVAERKARDRSTAAPEFGLAEASEGVILSTGANEWREFVVEMEHRRRSGRGVREWFLVRSEGVDVATSSLESGSGVDQGPIMFLSDHPLMRSDEVEPGVEERDGRDDESGEMVTSFNLQLTEKQRRDREGVNLPYFDAQREDGIGDGGRILYEMSVEDDFDEEEDEL